MYVLSKIINFILLPVIKMTKEQFLKQMKDNAVFQSIQYRADKCGYVCDRAYIQYKYPHICIYQKNRGWEDKHPDIYLETAHFAKEWNCKYTWKIGTVSYGSLEWEALEDYIKSIDEAFTFYKNVKDLDLYLLPTCPEEFED